MLRFFDQVLDAPSRLREGTYRAATLDATWRRFAPAAKPAGITRIADHTGLDTLGIPVFAAIRPLGKSLSTQQGKGLSPAAARISALMESLETFSAENLSLPVVRGSYRSLAKARNVVDVRVLPRPRKKLDLAASWRWVEGFDLVAAAPILVPEQAVSLDTTFTSPPIFDMSSNGLASGNVLVEAVVHGLCEVLERDAEAAWRRSGGDRRLVLDTITDARCRDLVDRITSTGARIFVWDLASDTNITAIGCAIMENPHEVSWRPLGMYQGFGAHWLPEIAISRAITEAAQTRLTYIAGGRDDFFPFDYERATDRELLVDIWERLAQPTDEPVLYDDLPRLAVKGLGDALAQIVAPLDQVIVVDLTHPTIKVPTVKVIVPGRATDVEALG
ncbi:MAG: YcaO-like family protein [Kofleriaceae bacterium]|nr:YcaO-like family protein [Kofleriaceae bacterium]